MMYFEDDQINEESLSFLASFLEDEGFSLKDNIVIGKKGNPLSRPVVDGQYRVTIRTIKYYIVITYEDKTGNEIISFSLDDVADEFDKAAFNMELEAEFKAGKRCRECWSTRMNKGSCGECEERAYLQANNRMYKDTPEASPEERKEARRLKKEIKDAEKAERKERFDREREYTLVSTNVDEVMNELHLLGYHVKNNQLYRFGTKLLGHHTYKDGSNMKQVIVANHSYKVVIDGDVKDVKKRFIKERGLPVFGDKDKLMYEIKNLFTVDEENERIFDIRKNAYVKPFVINENIKLHVPVLANKLYIFSFKDGKIHTVAKTGKKTS